MTHVVHFVALKIPVRLCKETMTHVVHFVDLKIPVTFLCRLARYAWPFRVYEGIRRHLAQRLAA